MKNALILIVTLLVANVLQAQDGLYAPVLPDDIALVRVIYAAQGVSTQGAALPGVSLPISIDIGTTRIGPVSPGSGSPYYPVRPGVYVIFAGEAREPLTAATKTFHTILITAGGINIVRDTHHDDPLRSQLILYNLTAGPLRLVAVMPSAPLLEEVRPGDAGSIVINAIPVTIAALRSNLVGEAGAPEHRYETSLSLERGESYAFVVTESEQTLAGFVVKAAVSAAEGSTGAE